MNLHSPLATGPHHDVLIVGAGISGISMAAHLRMLSPATGFAIVEQRDKLGGTWDLFRYPGVRSDSDMHSLGFRFEPWIDEKSIADGPAILAYLNRIVDERGIRRHIAFGTKVIAADWRAAEARWHVELEQAGQRRTVTARVLYLGSGYYDYDAPFDPAFAGREDFSGRIVHPQFWPADLDYAGKRVVVIGSGATAVTIVPAMAGKAAHVTMLQRTPTWMGARPSKDAIANWLRKLLPGKLAYKLTRAKNIGLHAFFFKRMRARPEKASAFLTRQTQKALGPAWSAKDFTPPYNPWEQRLCLVPDGDLFEAVRSGSAAVVTGTIERFEKDGIRLASGELIPADLIVTATGLALTMGGKIAISLDGAPVAWNERYFYRGCMFSNVPNLFVVFGYLNASWTLRADNTAEFACRVLELMRGKHADVVTPRLAEDHGLVDDDVYAAFSSGYLQRTKSQMPKNADRLPWRLNMDYFEDRRDFRDRPADDGVLAFENAPAGVPA
ncbi:MAG TPA: NAD(P)/FAD-dependent oxidoreductase [Croceibacterium sp.]|nr:NAD(P)/FAD-dependent oxidoreductase [Croceibacterium sp.]